ncbi:MAG: dephospho-CoA kinase [Nanoarchaeota archaeon]
MFKVLITGSIGSGKSTACKLFGEMFGIPVFCSDLQSRKIVNSNKDVIKKIKEEFGEHIYVDSELDRKALADIVFNDKNKLSILNSIVHPAVSEAFELWVEANEVFEDSEYVIEEAAIAIELGIQDKFDFVVVVTADEGVRIRRTMERDKCSEEKVRERINNQLSDQEKIKYADAVIINNDFPNLECQVRAVHKKILDRIKK